MSQTALYLREVHLCSLLDAVLIICYCIFLNGGCHIDEIAFLEFYSLNGK